MKAYFFGLEPEGKAFDRERVLCPKFSVFLSGDSFGVLAFAKAEHFRGRKGKFNRLLPDTRTFGFGITEQVECRLAKARPGLTIEKDGIPFLRVQIYKEDNAIHFVC